MSRIVKYPIDTSRDDRSRTMRRSCSNGAMPMSTAHAEAAAARIVVAVALSQ